MPGLRTALTFCTIFIVAAATTAPGWSAPLTVLSDRREVRAEAVWSYGGSDWSTDWSPDDNIESLFTGGTFEETLTVSSGAGYYADEGVGRSEQSTYVGATTFYGHGAASGEGDLVSDSGGDPSDEGSYYYYDDWTWGSGLSLFLVSFEVTEAVPWDLQASFLSSGAVSARRSIEHGVQLWRSGERPYLVDEESFFGQGFDVAESGILSPGLYSLRVWSQVDRADDPRAEASFAFTFLVPEPGTGLLVGAGLALLAGTRRSARSHA